MYKLDNLADLGNWKRDLKIPVAIDNKDNRQHFIHVRNKIKHKQTLYLIRPLLAAKQ